MGKTHVEKIREAVADLGTATPNEIMDWIRKHYPEDSVNPKSYRTEIVGCALNHSSSHHFPSSPKFLWFERDAKKYRLASPEESPKKEEPTETTQPIAPPFSAVTPPSTPSLPQINQPHQTLSRRARLVWTMSMKRSKRTNPGGEEITFRDKLINAIIWGVYNFFGTLIAVGAGAAFVGATEILAHPMAYVLAAIINGGWSASGYLVLARGIK